ncbi:GSCFA domain-containing protein [Aquirufa echingensis]|uniref:GSCFA domain-containing protein n=1 Tax=Aquirufa echingensis TaxID=3096516 RepID=A0ABW6CZZ9_9BACT
MINLTTTFSIPRATHLIEPNSQILCIGSCFAENMGKRLDQLPLEVSNQALGTMFHPLKILQGLREQNLQASDLYQQGNFYVHPDFHSQFMGENPTDFLTRLAEIKSKTIAFLKSSNFLIITWGTAFYYEDQQLGRAIANCHKQAASRFIKKQSTVEEICLAYESFLRENPLQKIILSVSPVRHTRDGIPENATSKAILRVAADTLAKKFPDQVSYFPAYEIMMDELRDYRFYQSDMIHPTEQAVEYIYKRFKQAHFEDDLLDIAKKWEEMLRTLEHRPHPLLYAQHREILLRLRKEIEDAKSSIDSSKMLAKIDQQILALS